MSVDDTDDYVRQPTRRTGSIVLGRSGGVVRMAVVNPNEVEAFLSHIVVDPKELEGIDRVAPRPVLHRDVPGPAGLQHAPRCARGTNEKAAVFLWIRLAGVILNRSSERL